MRKLMLGCLMATLAGCTQADKDRINAAFEPLDTAWRQQSEQNPLLGLDLGLAGVVAAHDVRAIKQLQRGLER